MATNIQTGAPKKKTKADFFGEIISLLPDHPDIVDFCNHEITRIKKRHRQAVGIMAKRYLGSPYYADKTEIKQKVLDLLSWDEYTVTRVLAQKLDVDIKSLKNLLVAMENEGYLASTLVQYDRANGECHKDLFKGYVKLKEKVERPQ